MATQRTDNRAHRPELAQDLVHEHNAQTLVCTTTADLEPPSTRCAMHMPGQTPGHTTVLRLGSTESCCCQLWLWPALVDFIGRNRAVEVALWRRAAWSADARDNVIGAASKTASPDVQMLDSDVALQANDRSRRPWHPDFQQNIQTPYPSIHQATQPPTPNARSITKTPDQNIQHLPAHWFNSLTKALRHGTQTPMKPPKHALPIHPAKDLLDFRPNRATHQLRTRNSLRNTQAPSP